MERILLTGASGLLGLNFGLRMDNRYQIIGVYSSHVLKNVPFTMVQSNFYVDSIEKLIDEQRPDAVIHCAAMANIDACQKDPEHAFYLNGEVSGKFASACKARSIPMIYISTDAVFDGKNSGKEGYSETDPVNPNNIYAESKLLGEQRVLENDPDAVIARVNFYGWSLTQKRSLGEIFFHNLYEGKQMMGFTDIFFCTLYAANLCDILEKMLLKNAKGLYHVFSSEYQSKYDFGVSIAERFGFDKNLIKPVSWKDGGLNAVRSPNLIMNTSKLQKFLNEKLPDQKQCLERFYEDYQAGFPEKISAMASPDK